LYPVSGVVASLNSAIKQFLEVPMTQSASDLLHEIFACPNVNHCQSNKGSSHCHPCAKIVSSQGGTSVEDFQRPEPWSGNLDRSPILFISPRPSIDLMEKYPVLDSLDWSKECISDFFMNRFNGKHETWVNDGLCVLRKDNNYGGRVRFWGGIGRLAEELLERKTRFGIDFTLTHVVHCKSTIQKIDTSAASECANKYLSKIINKKKKKIIVVLGSKTEKQVIEYVLNSLSPNWCEPKLCYTDIDNNKRAFVFVPSPSAPGYSNYDKSICGNISPKHFEILKSLLR
jgi:hypothetical protein